MRIMVRVFGLSIIFMFVCMLFMQMMSYNVRQDELTQSITTAMTGTQTVEKENVEDRMYGTNNARMAINDDTTYKNLFIKNFAKLVGGDEFTSSLGNMLDYKKYDSTVGEMPDLKRDGYTFLGWYTAADGGTKITSTTKVKGDTEYFAHWQIIQYTITYDLQGGTLQSRPTSYNIETPTFSIENPAKAGENFLGWKINGSSTLTKNLKIEKGTYKNFNLVAVWG